MEGEYRNKIHSLSLYIGKRKPNKQASQDCLYLSLYLSATLKINLSMSGTGGPISQDWAPVTLRKKAPTAAARKDDKAVNAARRSGAEIETVKKCNLLHLPTLALASAAGYI